MRGGKHPGFEKNGSNTYPRRENHKSGLKKSKAGLRERADPGRYTTIVGRACVEATR